MVADGLDRGRRPPVPMLALLMYHQVGRRPYQTRPARSVGRPAGVLLNAPRRRATPTDHPASDHQTTRGRGQRAVRPREERVREGRGEAGRKRKGKQVSDDVRRPGADFGGFRFPWRRVTSAVATVRHRGAWKLHLMVAHYLASRRRRCSDWHFALHSVGRNRTTSRIMTIIRIQV